MELLDTISHDIERNIKENSLILAQLIQEKIYISNESVQLNELITQWNETKDINFRYNLSKIIDNKLEDIFSYVNGIESIVFYLKDAGFYFYGSYPIEDELLVRNSNFYKKALEKKGEVLVLNSLDFSTKKEKNIISSVIALDDYVFNGNVETAFISINTDVFTNLYKNNSVETIGETVILDESNNVIFSTNSELINLQYNEMLESNNKVLYNEDFFSENINGEKKLIATRIIPKTNWKIVKLVNYHDLMGNITSINNIMIIIVTVIILLFVIFSNYFLRSIIIPIQNLIVEMRKVKQGNLEVEVEVSKQGEIAELSTTFNSMIKDVKKLLIANKEKEREKVEAEIDALQAQINPHFIANTLTSIRFMAMIAKVNNIRDMTEAFIKITSSTFNRNSKFTTIEKEIDTLKSYVHIMKVRHGNKYDVI
ncbi:MAG: cache domain-containing sensor histidine kinase, partial [Sarcina sp.]